jgi:hypothetical protein
MLAEIFMVQLEATARMSRETNPRSNYRFVPFNPGVQNEFSNGRTDTTNSALEELTQLQAE